MTDNEQTALPWRGKRADDSRWRAVSPERRQRARQLRRTRTNAEQLWQHLRLGRLDGIRFRRQHPVGTFIPDFYGPQPRLVLEVEGSVHEVMEVAARDAERQRLLEELGFRVLRLTNLVVFCRLTA